VGSVRFLCVCQALCSRDALTSVSSDEHPHALKGLPSDLRHVKSRRGRDIRYNVSGDRKATIRSGICNSRSPPCDTRLLYRNEAYPYVILALQSGQWRVSSYSAELSVFLAQPLELRMKYFLLNTSSSVHVAELSSSSYPEHTHHCLLSLYVHLSYIRIYSHCPLSS
jgi:hypothetical protein